MFKIAGGDIAIWSDNGVIMLKAVDPYGDPVELAEHEALELVTTLTDLIAESRDMK